MFASLDEAIAEGKAKATTLANGELDALHLRAEDARIADPSRFAHAKLPVTRGAS